MRGIALPTRAAGIAEPPLPRTGRLIAGYDSADTHHFVTAAEATRRDLATALFARVAAAGGAAPRIEPIPTSAYPTPARRPANSRLATTKITRDHGIAPRGWPAMLDDLVTAIGEQTA